MTAAVVSWSDVTSRYRQGDTLSALSGSSSITVDFVDHERICVRQRLWQACLEREQFDAATAMLANDPALTAMALAERLRTHYLSGPQVVTECNRTPNLAAVILRDLGATNA